VISFIEAAVILLFNSVDFNAGFAASIEYIKFIDNIARLICGSLAAEHIIPCQIKAPAVGGWGKAVNIFAVNPVISSNPQYLMNKHQ
jgi:hypothetical protein